MKLGLAVFPVQFTLKSFSTGNSGARSADKLHASTEECAGGGEGEGGFHGNGGGFHGEKLSITGAVDVVGIGGNVGMFGIM